METLLHPLQLRSSTVFKVQRVRGRACYTQAYWPVNILNGGHGSKKLFAEIDGEKGGGKIMTERRRVGLLQKDDYSTRCQNHFPSFNYVPLRHDNCLASIFCKSCLTFVRCSTKTRSDERKGLARRSAL